MEEKHNDLELLELGERMISLRFSMDSDRMTAIFREMSIPDYLTLSTMARRMRIHEPEIKVYLSEISKEMNLPINRVSSMVQNLQNKGYVYWEHDSRGTYIYLSETGRKAMYTQQKALQTFFENVISRMGKEAFVECLEQMELLDEMMDSEAERLKEAYAEGDPENKPEDN